MISAMLVCAVCATFVSSEGVTDDRVDPGQRAAYEPARAKTGRKSADHVRLALWCEARGLESDRLKHLAIAVLADPSNATARGLMGLVEYHGGWHSPDDVSAHVKSDEAYAAALASYNGRRSGMSNTVAAHWKMALWCEQHGLRPEATAHLARVVQLDPVHEPAWKRLGYRKRGRRWVTEEQVSAERAEAEAQKKADRHWSPILTRWYGWIGNKAREMELTEALATVADPRAVPSVWEVFGHGTAAHQIAGIQLLGRIDSPDSTRALVFLALDGKTPAVRARAIEMLRVRDPRTVAAMLVAMLRDPEFDPDPILFHYQFRPIASDASDAPGWLIVNGPGYDVMKSYTIPGWVFQSNSPWTKPAAIVMRLRERQVRDLAAIVSQILRESEEYVEFARQQVQQVDQSNAQVIRTLAATSGKDLGEDKEAWRKWWVEERGYAYENPPVRVRQDLTFGSGKPLYYEDVLSTACFAAGTSVRTLVGPRPIERIAVGDQVLTQDCRTGALSYHPIIEAPHNKPAKLYKIDLGHDVIKTTGIHRFWKAGHGWIMVRDLKPGDVVRSLGGIARVKSVEPADVEAVFNLKVMQAESFFVGASGLLVHDNSEVQPVVTPFDAALP